MVVKKIIKCLALCALLIGMGKEASSQTFQPMRFYESPATVSYGLNNRRTAILGNSTTIFGGYVGVQWGDRLKHVVTANSSIFWIRPEAAQQSQTAYHLNYIGLAEEYALLRWKRWQLVSFLHGGWGSFHERTVDVEGFNYDLDWVLPLELGGHLSYRATDWLDLIGGSGYRWVLFDETHALDGFYYKFSLSVDIKTLKAQCDHKRKPEEPTISDQRQP